ncbi:MAG: hypothetical protein C6Y22_22220 [Hapalosiphonaceae cyanobacterium JJU2]|nr:MAG: hypothetical protein C6Y22_22220 [Hapalosiphonaceae cyanobacterium JJU2]
MTTITAGTGATIKSLTAEAQLIETFTYLQLAEADTSRNTNARDYVQGNFNINTATFNGSFSFPVVSSVNSEGQVVTSAVSYLSNDTFTAGTGGTFKSTNPLQYLLEILIFLQNREASNTYNPQLRNLISFNADGDSSTYSGSVTLPISMALNTDGTTKFTAVEYLG